MSDRRQEAYAIRLEAAELARSRDYPTHHANGDEQRYANDRYFMSFTKGLPHDPHTGLLAEAQDFVEFRRAIDDGFIDPFTDRVRHGARYKVENGAVVPETDAQLTQSFRQWEAPTAGVVYELQGPDCQAVTMPPAPPLLANNQANPELIFELSEVYELAVLRDQPFSAFETGQATSQVSGAVDRLNALGYVQNQTGRPRKVGSQGKLDAQTVFRGSSPGVEVGPYLSQFLLIGNPDLSGGSSVADGQITYGALQIDQRVPVATPKRDYMTEMADYVLVQRGIQRPRESYVPAHPDPAKALKRSARRFISTPRDLATYVHYDALYEAYLNACIILLGMGTPFDPGFDHLSGVGAAAGMAATRRHAGGFALYGGPHILNLVTEVATRALKAVRFQKFNSHIRLRPEALAARVELVRLAEEKGWLGQDRVPDTLVQHIGAYKTALDQAGTLNALRQLARDNGASETYLLPMAFPEGSPMHPAYGAGHATVAGACVTILKAFFDTSAVMAKTQDAVTFKRYQTGDQPIAFRAPALPEAHDQVVPDCNLVASTPDEFLTLEGELNKLAANISIGRNMAGVHYFSDYYDSLRMGEQIALGILEEQALTYATDPFVLSVPTFDGDVVRIGRR
ncbi:MAG: vanadium-dependent haloperoxidase [Leptolyngbya sp. SIO4C1]|nr:vanadium-dependent haloperoxidase [Leptolyngbya sp. SIO4C1]